MALDVTADLSPALALLGAGAVQNRQASGPGAGRRVEQVGRDPERRWETEAAGPRQAHGGGFDLHANVRVGPLDRRGREHLVQYVLRPALAQQRLARLSDGRVVLTLPRPWRDGMRALVFAPLVVLERLAALTPRPRINLLVYHGVLAPNAPWRRAVVTRDGDDVSPTGPAGVSPPVIPSAVLPADAAMRPRMRPRYRAWAELMRRAFEADVLSCPRCYGRMVVLATIDDPTVIERILTHLELSMEPGEPGPGRAPPWGGDASARCGRGWCWRMHASCSGRCGRRATACSE